MSIFLTLVGLATASASECKCQQTSVASFHSKSEAIFFAGALSGTKSKYEMRIMRSVKGCLDVGMNASVEITCTEQPPIIGQIYLVGGKVVSKTKQSVKLTTIQCGWFSALSSSDTYWLASMPDRSCPKPRCADGSVPFTCKPNTCPAKDKVKAVCPAASKCEVNPCGGCAPQFFDLKGQVVCTAVCPDGSKPLDCTKDSCTASSPLVLAAAGCPEWGKAVRCVANSCSACAPVWTDQFGQPVCRNYTLAMCTDVKLINLGTASSCGTTLRDLGFAVLNGKCTALRGCVAGVPTFLTMQQCVAQCQCTDLGSVNPRPPKCAAPAPLGFALLAGKCGAVRGCAANVPARALFTSQASCAATCTPPETAKGVVTPKCPAGKPLATCLADPCAISWRPNCNQAKGQELRCESNLCGGCNAVWRNASNAVFTCPPSSRCDAKDSKCCLSGYSPVECTNIRCPFEKCANAVRCSADSCKMCELHFYDKDDNEIPVELCEVSGVEPAPVTTCDPKLGKDKCCPDATPPMMCPTGSASICGNIKCLDEAHQLIPIASCTTDPCSQCLPAVRDKKQAFIPLDKCYVVEQRSCPETKCPAVAPQCGPQPAACAQVPGLRLKCIMDPCACLSLWVDEVLGVQPSCVGSDWQRPCIPDSACPKRFQCDTPPDIPPEVAKNVACVQEKCTCRPMLSLQKCIPPQDCPKTFSCQAPPVVLVNGLSPEVLGKFSCLQANCTCQPILVPPADLLKPRCTPKDQCPTPNCETLYLQLEQVFPSSVVRRLVCGVQQCSCKPVLSAPKDASKSGG